MFFSYNSLVKEETPSKEIRILVGKSYRLLSVLKLLDLDPDPYIKYGSGSRRANKIQIQLDPDPQHCL